MLRNRGARAASGGVAGGAGAGRGGAGQREDPRPEQARTALAEAMVALVKSREGEEISVSELCKAAGVSRPTFYRHFRTADEVLARAVRQRLEAIDSALDEKPADGEPIPAEITDFLEDLWRERVLYRAALRVESPYHHTQRVTSDWLEETLRRHAACDGVDLTNQDTLVAFTAGGVLAVIAMLVEREELTREGIQRIGQELWDYAGRVMGPLVGE